LKDAQSILLDSLAMAGSSAANEGERQAAWEKIQQTLEIDASALVSDLSTKLEAHPITVRRWMNGENVPRHSMMVKIKAHLLEDTDRNAFDKPNSLCKLRTPGAAIWTLDRYLQLLPFAKSVFIFKSHLVMQAANNLRVLNLVQKAFDTSARLTVYYVVVENSNAEKTYEQLEEYIKIRVGSDDNLLSRLRKITLRRDQDVVGVEKGLPSPFVVLFQKQFWPERHKLAILYEMPVAVMDSNSQEFEAVTALVQVPRESAIELWEQWGPKISKMEFQGADGTKGEVSQKDWMVNEE
jgi:hypothetical protein